MWARPLAAEITMNKSQYSNKIQSTNSNGSRIGLLACIGATPHAMQGKRKPNAFLVAILSVSRRQIAAQNMLAGKAHLVLSAG
jgi:hypothetical protein